MPPREIFFFNIMIFQTKLGDFQRFEKKQKKLLYTVILRRKGGGVNIMFTFLTFFVDVQTGIWFPLFDKENEFYLAYKPLWSPHPSLPPPCPSMFDKKWQSTILFNARGKIFLFCTLFCRWVLQLESLHYCHRQEKYIL